MIEWRRKVRGSRDDKKDSKQRILTQASANLHMRCHLDKTLLVSRRHGQDGFYRHQYSVHSSGASATPTKTMLDEVLDWWKLTFIHQWKG
jgi:hypothetical protein